MEKKEPVIDFSAIVQRYRRYWWLFLLSLLACIAVAVMYLKVKKPVFLTHFFESFPGSFQEKRLFRKSTVRIFVKKDGIVI